ncbi:MAG: hypothetical protein UZ04_CHB001002218 [Chlorobi bacterium OLB4]|nr:MAG: hypothetical protein UZ04_CHB001002218 [Chlorobi bacterium OLB4]
MRKYLQRYLVTIHILCTLNLVCLSGNMTALNETIDENF